MADYKRIVSYIYQYNQQVKGNNVGFTRIETRNGQCKIIVHVRVPHLQDVKMQVFGYCWYDNEMHEVVLGKMAILNGVGEFKILTEADNLCDTQYRMADMGGILVYDSEALFLGTEWDDRPIAFQELHMDTKKPQDFNRRRLRKGDPMDTERNESIRAEEAKRVFQPVSQEDRSEGQEILVAAEAGTVAEAEQTITKEPEILQEAASTSDVLVAPEEEESTEQELPPEAKEENQPLSRQRMEQLDQKAQELFGSILGHPIADSDKEEEAESPIAIDHRSAIEFLTMFKSCESEEEYKEVLKEIESLYTRIGQLERVCREWRIKEARIKEQQQAKWEAEQEKQQIEEQLRKTFDIEAAERRRLQEPDEEREEDFDEEEEDRQIHPVVLRILEKYPSIEPFVDVDASSCVRIEPQDIGIFPMENWVLANNSFLLHGYYSYRHLIFFCKMVYNRPVYLLGVPGVNHSRERFMANMFGFSMFQPLTRFREGSQVQAATNRMSGNPAYDEVAGGEFGYWCMNIKF